MKTHHQFSKNQIFLIMCVCFLFSSWTFYLWRIIIIGYLTYKAKAHQILQDIKKIEKTAFLVLR